MTRSLTRLRDAAGEELMSRRSYARLGLAVYLVLLSTAVALIAGALVLDLPVVPRVFVFALAGTLLGGTGIAMRYKTYVRDWHLANPSHLPLTDNVDARPLTEAELTAVLECAANQHLAVDEESLRAARVDRKCPCGCGSFGFGEDWGRARLPRVNNASDSPQTEPHIPMLHVVEGFLWELECAPAQTSRDEAQET